MESPTWQRRLSHNLPNIIPRILAKDLTHALCALQSFFVQAIGAVGWLLSVADEVDGLRRDGGDEDSGEDVCDFHNRSI